MSDEAEPKGYSAALAPLTREEVAAWPALGPMGLKAQRVLALFDSLERAEVLRTRAKRALEILGGSSSATSRTQAMLELEHRLGERRSSRRNRRTRGPTR